MGGRKRQADDQRKNKYAQVNNRKGIPCILRNKNNTDITNSTRVLPIFRMSVKVYFTVVANYGETSSMRTPKGEIQVS